MKSYFLNSVFLMLSLMTTSLSGQVYTLFSSPEEVSMKFGIDKLSDIPFVTYPSLTRQELNDLYIQDSIADSGNEPYRFATHIKTNLSPDNSGIQFTTATHRIWIVGIHAREAKSLSLSFEDLFLPEGAEMFLINGNKDLVSGPMKASNFSSIKEISTEVFATDRLILYYSTPKEAKGNIKIHKIGYGYKKSEDKSLSCNVDITDDRGDCFRLEQRAVAYLLLAGSERGFSGTLINNTDSNNDLTPYILTANHCTFINNNDIDFGSLAARFRYWQGNSSTGWVTFFGVQQRVATGLLSDCSLLELDVQPNATDGLFYLGWSINNNPPNSSTAIHHPSDDEMKISRDVDASITNPNTLGFGTFPLLPSRAWRANHGQTGDFGALESGSSGSAMLNPDHRIVGQLKGGRPISDCEGINSDRWFGRFDVSWNTGTTAATRLADWLDPINAINANVQDINATFELFGNPGIPCPGIEMEMSAPLLQTNASQSYTYTWRTSSNLTIIGSGAHVRYTTTSCAGCPGWIECDITSPAACGEQLLATSLRTEVKWVNPGNLLDFRHTISPPTKNNGDVVGSFNTVCLGGNYEIKAGFEGILIPTGTVFQWTVISGGSIITPVFTSNGWGFGFSANATGFFTVSVTVLSSPSSCLTGDTETYTFQITSPCNSGLIEINHDNILADDGILVAPNPANLNVSVQLPTHFFLEETQIFITDMFGRTLNSITPVDFSTNLVTSELSPGVYVIEIRYRNLRTSKKLVISR